MNAALVCSVCDRYERFFWPALCGRTHCADCTTYCRTCMNEHRDEDE